MILLLFFFPFAVCRLFESARSPNKKLPLAGFFQDVFVVAQCLLLLSLFPRFRIVIEIFWALITAVQLLSWYCQARLQIPWSFQLLLYVPHLQSFSSSIRDLKIFQTGLSGFLLIALSLLGFSADRFPIFPILAIGMFAAIGAAFFYKPGVLPNPFFKWQWKRLFTTPAKKMEKSDCLKFHSETSQSLDPRYPLLRKTSGFQGEKQFDISLIPGEKPNILFLCLESFRAKNIGCLGAAIGASPHFDAWSKKGIFFRRFHANGLQTSRTFISTLFGIPAHLNTMSLHPYCSLPLIGLPEILKERGYHTALIQGASTAFDWTFPFFRKHGFQTIVGKEDLPAQRGQKTSWGVSDQVLFDYTAAWIDRQTNPFFLSLFTISNHHPWLCPPNWNFPIVGAHLPEPYRRFLQTYSYTDHCLGLFLERLERTGLLKKSILFIFGDHGQEMGERQGNYAIRDDLYQENLHVPLLILTQNKRFQPIRIDSPASQIDLLPTVIDLLGIEAIHHSVGKSLLRKSEAPVFFSLPQEEMQIGSIHGCNKLISSSNGRTCELYNLETDPEEKTNLFPGEKGAALKKEAESFFGLISQLYSDGAWAPADLEKTSFELKASPDSTDRQWIRRVANQSAAPFVNVSQCLSLTDRAIEAIGKEKGAQIHEFNLSNSPLFTDQSLLWISQNCPHLTIFNSSYCPLVTNRGIQSILHGCPNLRSLSLGGLDDLTDFPALPSPTKINALFLKESRNLTGKGLSRIVRACPDLDYLVASFEQMKNEDILELAEHSKELIYLSLGDGSQIEDRSLNRLLEANPLLSLLSLEGFPFIKSLNLEKNRQLSSLKFIDCPHLRDETLSCLPSLPIEHLCFVACPKITARGIEKLLGLRECRIILSQCSGIDPEAIGFLRSQGVNIF